MSTIKDVAQYTGLSIATISKYINGGNVLQNNKALIAEAIEKLDYKVNYAARVLKTNRTMTVGVLLPALDVPFFSHICGMLEMHLKRDGYSLILCNYYNDPQAELEKLRFLINQNVDGVILVPQYTEEKDINSIREIRDRKVSLVLIDRYIPGLEIDRVLVDNSNATYNAAEQLIINGHRRIGLITGPPEITTAHERRLGYERVHADYSLPVDAELIRSVDYSISGGYGAMNALLDMEAPPTAIMGTNSEMTIGAITAAYERKMRIPDDISFVGFDEVQLTQVTNPPTSIVSQPREEIAACTAEILLKRMCGDYTCFPKLFRLKTTFLSRESIKKLE